MHEEGLSYQKDREGRKAKSKAEATLNKFINWGTTNRYGRNYRSENDMDGEYTINLADKTPQELIYVVRVIGSASAPPSPLSPCLHACTSPFFYPCSKFLLLFYTNVGEKRRGGLKYLLSHQHQRKVCCI